jgi:hypothetical protein
MANAVANCIYRLRRFKRQLAKLFRGAAPPVWTASLESMREVYAADVGNGPIAVTL